MSVDLNQLKESIQGIFETANTTTASRDLSSGLERRVQKVLKVNPARIPIQASFYPCVTIYIDSKSIQIQDIARTQLNAKRRADIDVKIVGAVWNSNNLLKDEDPADDDCESLMENIEEILRGDPTVSGQVTWSFPTNVTYHQLPIDEETHLRAGFLNFRGTVFY